MAFKDYVIAVWLTHIVTFWTFYWITNPNIGPFVYVILGLHWFFIFCMSYKSYTSTPDKNFKLNNVQWKSPIEAFHIEEKLSVVLDIETGNRTIILD